MIKDSSNGWARGEEICLHKYRACILENFLPSWLNPCLLNRMPILKNKCNHVGIAIVHEILQLLKSYELLIIGHYLRKC